MRWRPTLLFLHRDIGYLCIGLTVVYAMSGIAVNHRRDWDYNYSAQSEQVHIGSAGQLLAELDEPRRRVLEQDPAIMTNDEERQLVRRVTQALGRAQSPKNVFWRGPERLSLFFETGERDTVDYNPRSGIAEHQVRKPRWVFRALNFLHLNESGRFWTWFADGYAAALVFLAVSGALVVKGKKGLAGRGGILLALGIVLPVAALVLLGYW